MGTGDTLFCEKCQKPLGIKRIQDHKIDISPLVRGTIKKVTIHRTCTKEIEYTIRIRCGSCGTNTEIKRKV